MINKVILLGKAGKDPELRHTASGSVVTTLSVATSERYKDKAGEWQEKTEWHNVVAFGKLAEIVGQYVTKGNTVFVEGKIQTRKWEDKTGATRYSTEIMAETVKNLSPKQNGASGQKPVDSAMYDAPPMDDTDYIPF